MRRSFERLLVGRTLAGRYLVREVIGSGGMSVVYRAEDATLGREVAVKCVTLSHETQAGRDLLRERFRREAAAAAQISRDPHVVQVHDYGSDEELGLDFLVMELLPGRDLKVALLEGPLSRDDALRVLRGAARGIAAGHRAGIVHRDVKPANIFLVDEGGGESVRVLDFGIAKLLEQEPEDALTRTGQLPHSPAYASPEQLEDGIVSAPSDVFQLGLIGYELLAGQRPFDDAARARMARGLSVPPRESERWDAVPPPIRAVIERALQVDPARRWADAAEMAGALDRAVEEANTVVVVAAPTRDDETLLSESESTVAAPPPRPVPAAPVVVSDPPAASDPPVVSEAPRFSASDSVEGVSVTDPPSTRPRRPFHMPRNPAVWVALAVIGIALLIAFRGKRGSDDVAAAPVADPANAAAPAGALPDSGAMGGLEEEFAGLMGEASARVEGTQPVAAAPAVAPQGDPPSEPTPADTSAAAFDPAREEANVRATLVALNESFVRGSLEEHVAFYADRVDFYNDDDASRAAVRRDRRQALERYDREKVITIHRMAVTFPEPGKAKALVDKEWDFRGSERRWEGSERQVYLLELRGGRWWVTGENDGTVYRSRRTRL